MLARAWSVGIVAVAWAVGGCSKPSSGAAGNDGGAGTAGTGLTDAGADRADEPVAGAGGSGNAGGGAGAGGVPGGQSGGPGGSGGSLGGSSGGPGASGGSKGGSGGGGGLLPPASYDGVCNEVGWCWQHPLPQGNTLRAAWAAAADDVWAVGDGGTVIHWDGNAWSSRRIPGVNEDFWAIWGSGPSDVWLGGLGNGYHWNGAAWAQTGPYGALAIHGSGPQDVWAAVERTGDALHYDGVSWKRITITANQGAGCNSVWAAGPRDVWLACTKLYHYDGSQFTSFDMSIVQLAGTGPSDVWAIDLGTLGKVWRWNGQQWSGLSAASGDELKAIWAGSPTNVWTVGRSGAIHQYDGRGWWEKRAEDGLFRYCVTGSGANDVWVGGDYGSVLRGNGSSWVAMSESGSPLAVVTAVWAGGGDVAWAATNDGLLRRQQGQWTVVPGTTGAWYFDVWGSGPNDVWAVASSQIRNPVIVNHWNGATLTEVTDSPVVRWGASVIAGSAANNVWFVGESELNGWDGSKWTTVPFTADPDNPITDAWTSGPNDLWVLDRGGRVRRWDGTTFGTMRSSGTSRGIWGAAPNDVWTVGASASHWDGQTWKSTTLTPTISVSDKTLYAVGGSASNDVWAVMAGGYAFHFDGQSWKEVDAAVFGIFNSVSVAPDHGVLMSGPGPVILSRAP